MRLPAFEKLEIIRLVEQSHLPFDQPPALEDLQAGVGDYFQAVPSFDTISYGGTVLNCIAFCNEHGKLDHLPINEGATIAWEGALQRALRHELRDKSGMPAR